MRPVLVDSSVWINFFNGQQTWAVDELDRLLVPREALIGDLILMEVLQGISAGARSMPWRTPWGHCHALRWVEQTARGAQPPITVRCALQASRPARRSTS